MHIHISPHDGVPIYLQIANQVKYLVASGRLMPGAEMPPHLHVLAEQLTVNPKHRCPGLPRIGNGRIGRKVVGPQGPSSPDGGSPTARARTHENLAERIDALLAEARQMNVSS